jgi:hypothetical protein
MIHLFAALGEKERALISQGMKAAVSAAKARGQKLGNPNISAAREAGATALKANADRHAAKWEAASPERAGEGLTPSLRGLAIFAFFAVFLPVPG